MNTYIYPINGLYLFDDVMTEKEEADLITMIDLLQEEGSSIRNKIRTRITMHFGHTFSASMLRVDPDDQPPKIPEVIRNLIDKSIRENKPDDKSLEC